MFAPLSLAAKEHLAARLAPVAVPAGARVVTAGDAGDRFYIVDSGDLEITVGDMHKPARAGDYFGEIALLRDTPRTATVTATTDAHLYELDRADFLAAVTGHALATSAAHEVVDARLAGAV
jgi:CRP-like cAMP-binding protein